MAELPAKPVHPHFHRSALLLTSIYRAVATYYKHPHYVYKTSRYGLEKIQIRTLNEAAVMMIYAEFTAAMVASLLDVWHGMDRVASMASDPHEFSRCFAYRRCTQ